MPNASITRATSQASRLPFQLMLSVCLMLFFLASTAANAGSGIEVILQADFNNKTVNAPIGTGGAALGEPINIAPLAQAVVVGPGPFASNSLRFTHTSTTATQYMRFAFIGGQEISTGKLQIITKLKPSTLHYYRFNIREANSSASTFATINLEANGDILLRDAGMTTFTNIGSYAANDIIKFVFLYDLSTGTYSVLIDDIVVVVDRPHGVTTGDGIGGINIGSAGNADEMYVDDILVTHLSDELYDDGFE